MVVQERTHEQLAQVLELVQERIHEQLAQVLELVQERIHEQLAQVPELVLGHTHEQLAQVLELVQCKVLQAILQLVLHSRFLQHLIPSFPLKMFQSSHRSTF